jgi:hypothetical protein
LNSSPFDVLLINQVSTITFSMIYRILILFFTLSSFSLLESPKLKTPISSKKNASNVTTEAETIYYQLNANHFSLPNFQSFFKAFEGFNSLKSKGLIKNNILTIIDFSLSSNVKRLWVIDLTNNIILFNTLVAHGRNTGDEFATTFSNAASSFKSSLGLYVTGEIYNGKHGISLKLDGLEKGINDQARARAVVVHGAEYVSNAFIKLHKRLGRSLGCPAIPVEFTEKIIKTIKNKSCVFIYHS